MQQQTKLLIQSRTGTCLAEPQTSPLWYAEHLLSDMQLKTNFTAISSLPWEQLVRETFFTPSSPQLTLRKAFCFNDANQANSIKYTIVHKPDALSHWSERFIYPNIIWCPKFTVQNDDLGIIPFPVFWFRLGTVYYSHKICFNYKIWCHLSDFLKGASSPSRTYSVVP